MVKQNTIHLRDALDGLIARRNEFWIELKASKGWQDMKVIKTRMLEINREIRKIVKLIEEQHQLTMGYEKEK